jgi:DNA-directed RNA polymerase alpha subunit
MTDASFDDCGVELPVRVRNCLINEGCRSLEDAATVYGRKGWLGARNFGLRSLRDNENALREIGLSLAVLTLPCSISRRRAR